MAKDNAATYRSLAAECLMQASISSDSIVRDALFERAQTWMRMADDADAGAPRVAQQQQQIQPKEPEGDK
jgi:hypothetical protein